MKSAWQIVDDANPPGDYITARAVVPILSVENGQVFVSKDKTRTVTVALLSLHVVFVLDIHPEFIWSTFEHVDNTGTPDLAPLAAANPSATPSTAMLHSLQSGDNGGRREHAQRDPAERERRLFR
jgi:hypothetical protein